MKQDIGEIIMTKNEIYKIIIIIVILIVFILNIYSYSESRFTDGQLEGLTYCLCIRKIDQDFFLGNLNEEEYLNKNKECQEIIT